MILECFHQSRPFPSTFQSRNRKRYLVHINCLHLHLQPLISSRQSLNNFQLLDPEPKYLTSISSLNPQAKPNPPPPPPCRPTQPAPHKSKTSTSPTSPAQPATAKTKPTPWKPAVATKPLSAMARITATNTATSARARRRRRGRIASWIRMWR